MNSKKKNMATFNHKKYDLPLYPEKVQDFLRKLIPNMRDLEADLSTDKNNNPSTASDELFEAAITATYGENVFKRFLKTGDVKLSYDSDDSLVKAMSLFIATLDLYSLREKGILDCVKDDNGEEIFFLNKKFKNIK